MSDPVKVFNPYRDALIEIKSYVVRKHQKACDQFIETIKALKTADTHDKKSFLQRRIQYWSDESHTLGNILGLINPLFTIAELGGSIKDHYGKETPNDDALIILETENQKLREEIIKLVGEK